MNLKFILLFIFCFGPSLIYSQNWIFEYASKSLTQAGISWSNEMNQTTIHGIGVSPDNMLGKDTRTRLIELNQDGQLISYFRTIECTPDATYHPSGQDRIMTVVRKGKGDLMEKIFNVFDSTGKNIWTTKFDKKFSLRYGIADQDGITVIKTNRKGYNAEFHFLEFSLKEDPIQYSFFLDDFQTKLLRAEVRKTIKIAKGEYVMGIQLFEIDERSVATNHYPKVLLVKEGNLQWVKNFKGIIKKIGPIWKTKNGFLILGDNKTIITLDKSGNITNTFKAKTLSHTPRFHVQDGRLFSIEKKQNQSIIYISEFNLDTGELIWQKSIATEYSSISNLSIGVVGPDYIILTGSCIKSALTNKHRAFVMRKVLADSLDEMPSVNKVIAMPVEDLVQEVSEDLLNVKVYPNALTFRITFDTAGEKKQEDNLLSIFAANGSLVLSKEFVGNQIETDISTLPKGTYIYTIAEKSKENIIQGKFIAP